MSGVTLMGGINPPAALMAALQSGGADVVLVQGASEADWLEAVRSARLQGGVTRVIILLTNPAPDAVLGSIDLMGFDAAFAQTVGLTYAAMRATVPEMREVGGGWFLTVWLQRDADESATLLEPVCLGALELASRVIAKEYAEHPTVNVNLVHCRVEESTVEVLAFWAQYLGGEAGCYVTGNCVGRPAH